jgi:hypothetical protein
MADRKKAEHPGHLGRTTSGLPACFPWPPCALASKLGLPGPLGEHRFCTARVLERRGDRATDKAIWFVSIEINLGRMSRDPGD